MAMLILTLFLLSALIRVTIIQQLITRAVTQQLSHHLGVTVSVGFVYTNFIHSIHLGEVYMEDLHRDTLLYVGDIRIQLRTIPLLQRKLVIRRIDIDKLRLYVHRKPEETLFNYQFILHKFTSADTSSTEFTDMLLSLKHGRIRWLKFYVHDERLNKRAQSTFTNLIIKEIKYRQSERILEAGSLVIDDWHVVMDQFAGNSFTDNALSADAQNYVSSLSVSHATTPTQPFSAQLKHLLINDAHVAYNNHGRPQRCQGIDYNHLSVSRIKVFAEDITYSADSLRAAIRQISGIEQNGFQLQRMKADFLMSRNSMRFDNLIIETPHSYITNYLSMSYNKLSDFSDFIHKVHLRATFRRTIVSMHDINHFAHALNGWEHNMVNMEGDISGTIDRLRCRNLLMELGKQTRISADIDFTGLPQIHETFISARIDRLRTDASDIEYIYPALRLPESLHRLGSTRVSGHFDGFLLDFVANAQILTQVGLMHSDVNVKFTDNYRNASYRGHLSVVDFHIGSLLGIEKLGKATCNVRIEGSGIRWQDLETSLIGHIEQIYYQNYPYSQVSLNGKFSHRAFYGTVVSLDPNARLRFDGAIDLSDTVPVFDFQADIDQLHLKKINWINDDISLSSHMNLNFSGTNIDQLVGSLHIKDTRIIKEGRPYDVRHIELESIIFEEEGTKKITLESDVLNAEVRGKINFKQLPIAMQYFFQNYFKKNALELDMSKAKDFRQDFSFYININDHTKNLTELISPQFKNIGQTHVEGSMNSENNLLILRADCHSIAVGDFQLCDIHINARATPEKVWFSSALSNLMYRDSLLSEEISLHSSLLRDTINFSFFIQDSLHPNRVRLHGIVRTDLKSLNAEILHSAVWFKGNRWDVSNNNHIYYSKKKLLIHNLHLAHAHHQLTISTALDTDSSTHLLIELKDVLLEEVLAAFPSVRLFKLRGIANGKVTILHLFDNPMPMASIDIDNFHMFNHYLGLLSATSQFRTADKKISFNAALWSDVNDVLLKGWYDATSESSSLDMEMLINKLSLGWTESLLDKVLNGVEGNIQGMLRLRIHNQKPILTGNLFVDHAYATVTFLNMYLSMKKEEIFFEENLINLGQFALYDQMGNSALGKGSIKHHYFSNFLFDITAQSERFQVMNTTAAVNSQFYGKAFASVKMAIRGPVNDLDFHIEATTLKNTKVSIAVSESKEVSRYSFYRFIQRENTESNSSKLYTKRVSGVNFTINLIATPEAEVELVLSSNQGDVISAKGEGSLKISYDKYQDLSIIGNYTVTEGEYLFSMQNVISKKFQINRGSQIVWAGNPYDAKLSISALYRLRASPYDLIEDIVKSNNEKMQQARIRVLVNLLLNISGTITDPEISFDIKVPDADPAIKSALQSKLDFIRLEQNELNKQVVGLLVLNKFLPVYALGTTNDNTANIATGASNTVSEFVTNQLSIYLSDWLSKFVTDVQLDIGYRTYQTDLGISGSESNEMENRRELQLALSKSFFNDRVYVDVGGNFDFSAHPASSGNNGQQAPRGNNVAGDFEVQYALTADGRYKLKAFRRGEYDIFSERNRNKTGVGLLYKKEFDDWNDLVESFRVRKSRKKPRNENE